MRAAPASLLPVIAVVVLAGVAACTTPSAHQVAGPAPSTSSAATDSTSPSATPAASPRVARTSTTPTKRRPSATSTGYTPSLADAPKDHPSYYKAYCQVPQPLSTTRLCSFGDTTDPVKTIALVGDSVANEWLAALVDIGTPRHWKIVTDEHSRCPWSAAMTVNTGQTVPYVSCHRWGIAVTKDVLTRIKPDVVVTSDRPVLGTPDHLTPGRASRAQIGAGMATYWRAMAAHHIPVVAIRESPEMGFDVPQCLAGRSVAACTVPASRAVTHDPPTVVAARLVHGPEHLVNMNGVICPHRTCRPVSGRIVIYRDLHHLTATYVHSIASQLEQRLFATGVFGPRA